MLIHHNNLPFQFPTRTLDSFFFFTSKSPSYQNPKPHKSVIICNSSSTKTNAETLNKSAIERIAEKLRSLGYVEDEKQKSKQKVVISNGSSSTGEIFLPSSRSLPKHRVGYTIDTSWSTPENPVPKPGSGNAISRFGQLNRVVRKERRVERKEIVGKKVPTLAELAISPEELKRLKKIGIALKKRLKVGVAGITEGIVNGIHERWRRSEVVKIKCEDLCKLNMKRTHDTLERKTGGMVVWRSGSTIIIYRGVNYKYPYFLTNSTTDDTSHDELGPNKVRLVPAVGSPNKVRFLLPGEAELVEEADCLLDGLGPRFIDWWGLEPLPIDADRLPAIVPGYRRPFRLLPYGVKPKLTDDEMTILRRLARPLPCHFALGRNKKLEGLAASMVRLWEKCEIAKIAVKRGVQNTNSLMMAEELKRLTGGTLISRDKEFITLYRGKDFLPPAVSRAIAERRKPRINREKESTCQSPSNEKMPEPESRIENATSGGALYRGKDFLPPAVSRAIAERRKPRIHREKESTSQSPSNEKMPEPESRIENATSGGELQVKNVRKERKLRSTNNLMKRISSKLSRAVEKKEKAEKLLAKLEEEAETREPEIDREGITEEERYMLKKVGLRMKPFLLLGRRGVFDGTIENMHLHWKYRELVKIIATARGGIDLYGVARTLEAESGGILVAVERVNRGYAIIVYRGKNYQRPDALRPQTLLNKKQAMKRSLEAQRSESLKLHVLKLNKNIDELKLQLVKQEMEMNHVPSTEHRRATVQYETSDHLDSVVAPQNQINVTSVESANSSHSPEATEGHGSHLNSLNSDDSMDDAEEDTHLEKLTNYVPQYDDFAKTKVEPIPEAVVRETDSDFQDEVRNIVQDDSFPENSQGEVACPVTDKAEFPASSHGSHSTSLNSDCSMDEIDEATHLEKLMNYVPQYDEFAKAKLESMPDAVVRENNSNRFLDEKGNVIQGDSFPENAWSQGGEAYHVIDKPEVHASDQESVESSIEKGKNLRSSSVRRDEMRKGFKEGLFRAEPLSNKERLILRREALKMKRRPVLAIGRSNVVTGVAKAIKTHFQKHSLAIVNVKGRAKGTSVQELVFKLEQATGAVMVSHEPSKVILYRGWEDEEEPEGFMKSKTNARKVAGRKGGKRNMVSPQLMDAIRLECGLLSSKKRT